MALTVGITKKASSVSCHHHAVIPKATDSHISNRIQWPSADLSHEQGMSPDSEKFRAVSFFEVLCCLSVMFDDVARKVSLGGLSDKALQVPRI